MNNRLSVTPGSPADMQLKLLADILSPHPEALALLERLEQCLAAKGQSKAVASEDTVACQCA